ncbi:MAG: PQQ-dependent sugar dehydrogenase [Gemmatimonadota bacterium]
MLTTVAAGLTPTVLLTAPPGDGRLFIVEQSGLISIVSGGQLVAEPFLDITDRVRSGGELGLLGLAFHPQFAANGRFYVHYTRQDGGSRIARFEVGSDADVADPATESAVLDVAQPFSNHNGGMIAFGPDGNLFIGMGDGGSGGDPLGSGQDEASLLGAMLRIDVDGTEPYAIPSGNPFPAGGAARPEIWALGLRNPWRFSIDPVLREIWIGDVGQDRLEEINRASLDAAGLNYGWNVMEGSECFATASCDATGLTLPVLEYAHGEGCSVIGGHVYRGAAVPALRGHYFFSDFCSGFIRSIDLAAAASSYKEWITPALGQVLSFGVDGAGELYVLTSIGRVWRVDGTAE